MTSLDAIDNHQCTTHFRISKRPISTVICKDRAFIFVKWVHFLLNLFSKFVQIFWDALLEDATFGAGEDDRELALFAQELHCKCQ